MSNLLNPLKTDGHLVITDSGEILPGGEVPKTFIEQEIANWDQKRLE